MRGIGKFCLFSTYYKKIIEGFFLVCAEIFLDFQRYKYHIPTGEVFFTVSSENKCSIFLFSSTSVQI